MSKPCMAEVLAATVARDGFAHARAADMRALFAQHGGIADWAAFAASWDDLGLDVYMADGGRYRRRRHAAFTMRPGSASIHRKPHQPHYQSRDYNPLNGGVERWFQPVAPAIGAGATMTAILSACRDLFDRLTAVPAWHIEVHQFRIESRPGEAGQPTPEGMHRDGVDQVLVLLVRRENVRSGETSIHDLAGHKLGSFTLAEPLEAALVDDNRVFHGVTPVEAVDPQRPAFRDVLVVTFRRE
ncbi:MAG: 2OG-Fe dioxygenase family protein [Acetobacteraceae bacterium]|nr:2OG-Fe dioxygenase family protein [Acetobacteraceae bacterium]